MSEHDPSRQGWQTIPTVDSDVLAETRLQIHWSAQVVAAIGNTHLDKAPDDGQSNFGWVDGMQLFAGRYLGDPPAGFGSFTPRSHALNFHEPGGEVLTAIEVDGKTLDEVYTAMEQAIAHALDSDPVSLKRPPYDMPSHPVGNGKAFGGTDDAAREALHIWFHDANLVMRDLKAKTTSLNATLPRLWPHHFDLGMLISLEEHGDPSQGRSIGIGLAPGDENDPLPYWYVNAYPAPDSIDGLPQPSLGGWNDGGFTGLKLDAATTVGDGTGQEERVRAFLGEAVAICRDLLTAD